jgi:hypothetical protein
MVGKMRVEKMRGITKMMFVCRSRLRLVQREGIAFLLVPLSVIACLAYAAEPKQGEDSPKAYRWFSVEDLVVPEDWHPDAWYRKPGVSGIRYDLGGNKGPEGTDVASGHVIVVRSQADEVERFAADELQRYLGRIVGRHFPIVDRAPSTPADIVFNVGTGLSDELKGRGEDDYLIAAESGQVVLSGTTGRSTLYSVYTFLERYLGCRWYFADPSDEVVPTMKLRDVDALVKGAIHDIESPVMSYRALTILSTCDIPGAVPVKPRDETGATRRWFAAHLQSQAQLIDWMAKNRYNTVLIEGSWQGQFVLRDNWDLVKTLTPEIRKRGLHYGLGGHFWNPFMCTDTPGWPGDNSWGPFRGGKRLPVNILINLVFCTTNHDAVRTFLSEIVSFYRVNREFDLWAVWSPDGTNNACECEVCKPLALQERLIRMQNLIKQALDNETAQPNSPRHGDRIANSLLAYGNIALPPVGDVRLSKGILVAPDVYHDFSKPYAPSEWVAKWRNYLAASGEKPPLVLFGRWTRTVLTGYHLLPPDRLDETMRQLVADGFVGIENFHGLGGWWLKGLPQYATGKLMWNPASVTRQSLCEDYFLRYFGPASEPMQAFYTANEVLHMTSEVDRHYADNWDISYPGKEHACTGIDPQEERSFPGFLPYLEGVLSLAEPATKWFEEGMRLAETDENAGAVKRRIQKVQDSWNYFYRRKLNEKLQLDGLRLLEQARETLPGSGEYTALLDKAEASFREAQGLWQVTLKMIREQTVFDGKGEDTGVFWDGGTLWTYADHGTEWLDIVERMRIRTREDTKPLWKLQVHE